MKTCTYVRRALGALQSTKMFYDDDDDCDDDDDGVDDDMNLLGK